MKVTKIWDGINVIADDRIPEGYIGIDGAFGLELIRIDVNYVESDVPDTTKLVARAVYTSPHSHGRRVRMGRMRPIRLYTQLANALAAWIARRWQTTGGVVLLGAITGVLVAAVGIAVHWSVR